MGAIEMSAVPAAAGCSSVVAHQPLTKLSALQISPACTLLNAQVSLHLIKALNQAGLSKRQVTIRAGELWVPNNPLKCFRWPGTEEGKTQAKAGQQPSVGPFTLL